MKKIVLALVATWVCGATVMASDIAISTQAGWYSQGAADREMQEIVDRVKGVSIERFTAGDHAALASWVKEHTGDGACDLLILNGQFPSTIYAPGNAQADGSLAELFLDDGNCIINTGDYMFYVVDGAGTNAEPGLEAMMDLAHIAMWDDDTPIVITADGKNICPTLVDYACDRPWHLDELQGDWYPELILGQNAAGTRAEPAIIANRVTGGRLGTFYQTASQDNDPRGETISEWINNWFIPTLGGKNPLARGPNPKDESMVDNTMIQASWKPGDFALLHDVYFGESLDEVAAATKDTAGIYVGRQATTQLVMGLPGGAAPAGLVPGKNYYWRVDEINDGEPNSPWKGNVWTFTVRPLAAFDPQPLDGMKHIDPNQDLSWDIGMGTIFHTVFFGKSLDEVTNAVAGGTMSAVPSFDPGTLEQNTTYYWRIDEFAFPANKTTKGPVWSFTTGGPGGGAKAAYFNGMALEGDPVLTRVEPTINFNTGAEVVAGLSDNLSARWTANLEVPFTGTWKIIATGDDGVRLWIDGRLVANGWVDQGPTDYIATLDLVAGQFYSVRMEWYENGGGAMAQLSWEGPGISRQVIPSGWLALPLRATVLSPANLEPHAPQDAVLQWIAGEEATDHDVYFGEDEAAVAAADTSTAGIYKGRQPKDEITFDPGSLEWGKTYYWRVDEVGATQTWKGSVWSFTAADFLIVDDMESYTDEEGVGARIYETWIDGYADQSSGSTVGYIDAPFAEQSIIHGGRQSMPLDYNNVNAPYFSEATTEWSAAQNWTVNGVSVLTLYFRGQAGNGQEKLYVTLTDSANKSATVVYADSAALATAQWTEWKIPLSSFTGVNAAKIKKMVIGLGDRSAPKAGGAGLLLIDDIWVTKP